MPDITVSQFASREDYLEAQRAELFAKCLNVEGERNRALAWREKLLAALKIATSHDCPPVPTKQYDWSCVSTSYEPGMKIGHGATEVEAIADLIEQEMA